jgi:hypothetical protein
LDDRVELFKITCVTCRARLSVRDASLIGQIIGCPRCGMMVQVAAPAAVAGPSTGESSASLAAIAATSVVTPPLPEFADATVDTAPDIASPPETVASFDDAADILTSNSAPNVVTSPAPSAAIGWAKYKFVTLVGAGALGGSLIVAAALSWSGGDKQTAKAATAPAAPRTAAPLQHSKEPTPTPAPSAADDEVETTAADDAAEAFLPIETPEETIAEPAPIESTSPTPTTPEVQGDAEANAAAVIEEAAVSSEQTPPSEESPPVEADPAPRLRIDPLDVDPEGLNLSTLYSGPPKDPLAESQLAEEEAPAPSVPPADSERDADEPAALPAPRTVHRDERAGVGAPADAASLLARRLPAVKFDKLPLCRLLDLSVQVSGLPVSAGPDQLRMAAASAATPASVDAKDATIEQVLRAALKPLRLEPVVADKHVVIKRVGDNQRRAVDYPVDDLASSGAEITQLAAWVEQLAAPGSWVTQAGDAKLTIEGAKLHVDAPVSVQFDVLFLLERYRLTRGLPTRTKYPSALLAPGSVHAKLSERLAAPAVFTFSQYAPLREIFRYWQAELGVAVLVDWPALEGERLWPNTRIACSAADKTWAEAMDSVLEPLGLGWRAVDRNTIELTTLARVRTEPQLELYEIAPNASINAEALIARVQSLAPATADQQVTPAIVYDAKSRVLLVRQPAALQRRLVAELGDILASPAIADAR